MEEREVEQGLLGAILKKPAVLSSVMEIMTPNDFTWLPYREMFEVMIELNSNGLGIDSLTVGDLLHQKGKLEEFSLHNAPTNNGRAGIMFIRSEGRSENAISYAQIAKNYAQNREIMKIMSNGAAWVTNGRSPADIISDITKQLNDLDPITNKHSKSTITFNEAISRAWDKTAEAEKGNVTFLQTGFKYLDDLMLGLSAPDFTIVAARPGVGKTAFLASVVYNIVRRYPQKRIAFFSLEMGSEQVAMRFISMFSGITYNTQRSGKFGFNEYDGYVNAVGELTKNNYNLFINDLPSIKPSKVKQELRKLGAIDLLVFDYLQLAESDEKKEQRHLEVGAVSRALKHLAKELDIPVLTAAQLKRNNNEKPVMSDLAESSYLERDADNIIFLHREFGESNTFVTLAKQRNGATGECILNYNGARTMFEDRVVGNTK